MGQSLSTNDDKQRFFKPSDVLTVQDVTPKQLKKIETNYIKSIRKIKKLDHNLTKSFEYRKLYDKYNTYLKNTTNHMEMMVYQEIINDIKTALEELEDENKEKFRQITLQRKYHKSPMSARMLDRMNTIYDDVVIL